MAALAAGLAWPALVQADTAEQGRTGSAAVAPTAARGDFAARVAIPGGRRLYLECRGAGSPTVVLEAGTGDRSDVWSTAPAGPGQAVLRAVARFTRVCAYDRPGTYASAEELSRSDPVAMPRSARRSRAMSAALRGIATGSLRLSSSGLAWVPGRS